MLTLSFVVAATAFDEAECAAVRRGEINFPGIGKPSDL